MGGKSTFMRQTALIVIAAHIGAFVPADHAEIGPIKHIFTRIGASDDISDGKSTFMLEMTEAANILHNCGPESLVLMDEIGRGTSTADGMAIAWASAEYLSQKGAMTLFATHYLELTALADTCHNAINTYFVATEHSGTVIFLHQIKPGPADSSYGLHVAQLAGMPHAVIARAQQVADTLGNSQPTINKQEYTTTTTNHPALQTLSTLDTNNLSPMEALKKIEELQALASLSD